jgi:hypothetical protein
VQTVENTAGTRASRSRRPSLEPATLRSRIAFPVAGLLAASLEHSHEPSGGLTALVQFLSQKTAFGLQRAELSLQRRAPLTRVRLCACGRGFLCHPLGVFLLGPCHRPGNQDRSSEPPLMPFAAVLGNTMLRPEATASGPTGVPAATSASMSLTVPEPAIAGMFERNTRLTTDVADAVVRAVVIAVPDPAVRPLLDSGAFVKTAGALAAVRRRPAGSPRPRRG